MAETENRTEMEYLELAKHAKDTIEIKDQEIERIMYHVSGFVFASSPFNLVQLQQMPL